MLRLLVAKSGITYLIDKGRDVETVSSEEWNYLPHQQGKGC